MADSTSFPGITVIALGGGGFTHLCDPALDDYIIQQARVSRPRIGFLPTASGDSRLKIERFYRRFHTLSRGLSHRCLFGHSTDLEDWVLRQDIIYAGGGNTRVLLDLWQQHALSGLLLRAARNGTVLAGVSAGAVCWFEAALSDSDGLGLSALPCLGFVKGSCCPHYLNEPERRPAFEQYVARGWLPPGVAIDDGAAVHVVDGEPTYAVAGRPGSYAYRVGLRNGQVSTEALPLIDLSQTNIASID